MMGAQDAIAGVDMNATERRAAFTALYKANVAEVYRFVHRRCQDRSIAQDITHDTFLTAVRTVEDPSEINTGWLLRVARNRLIDVLRRGEDYSGRLRLIGSTERNQSYEDDTVRRLRVEAAMEQLSVDHRLVLTLHYLDGKSVPELAEQLGRSVKSVEGLVTRARRNMQRELEKHDG